MGRLTVGDLRGQPQWRGTGAPSGLVPGAPPALGPGSRLAPPHLPPSKRGKGCCRKGCRGCPWAESVRASLLRPNAT